MLKEPTFYNDIDDRCCAWAYNLVKAGLVPKGGVSGRSISEITPPDLEGIQYAHFFSGILGWPLALQWAGWPFDKSTTWTGSCPCQPFSVAGKGAGTEDERHLWPVWKELIRQRRPNTIFGEQVSSPLGRKWLAGVQTDLEEMGYRFGASDLCAAGLGAPHIRQRLYWVADTKDGHGGGGERRAEERVGEARERRGQPRGSGEAGSLGNANRPRFEARNAEPGAAKARPSRAGEPSTPHRLEQPQRARLEGQRRYGAGGGEPRRHGAEAAGPIAQAGSVGFARGERFWDRYALAPCSDGKARRIEPGTFPLADGVPGRVELLRGYGNAIVPSLAAVFIRAYMDVVGIAPEVHA